MFGVPFQFSPWGLVSGLFMVPGGTAGYYAVQTSGLAVSQGIWCSLKVLVSFGWGIFIFHEPVRSQIGASVAIVMLMVGLSGMSYFASVNKSSDQLPEEEPLLASDEEGGEDENCAAIALCCRRRRNKYWGYLGACIDGAYGGSVLVPMHYARGATTAGLGFMISFGVGCASVLVVVWMLRWAVLSLQAGSIPAGWQMLPRFHWQSVGPYAVAAGLIWSIGNATAILAVAFLG